jgi:hypothetical protein
MNKLMSSSKILYLRALVRTIADPSSHFVGQALEVPVPDVYYTHAAVVVPVFFKNI